jgi:septal ring factor EnvC (AmiA/AmiB activator)
MDEKPFTEREIESQAEAVPQTKSNAWPWAAALLLCCAVIVTLTMFFREQDSRRQLATANAQMSAELDQMHDQVQALNAKVSALMAMPPAQPIASQTTTPPEAEGTLTHPKVRHTKTQKHIARDDPRWRQMQSQLDENKQQIDATKQAVANTRTELEGNLNSAKDELGGSIARTHDELVALEKRGERSYYEFSLAKSKTYERVGPVSLSLRKTNVKNAFYDVSVLVEDSRLNKKHISLFEPVLFYPSDSHQPLELVVNRIDKDAVRGYVSAPKYKETQAAGNATGNQPSPNITAPDAKVSLERRPGDQQ